MGEYAEVSALSSSQVVQCITMQKHNPVLQFCFNWWFTTVRFLVQRPSLTLSTPTSLFKQMLSQDAKAKLFSSPRSRTNCFGVAIDERTIFAFAFCLNPFQGFSSGCWQA